MSKIITVTGRPAWLTELTRARWAYRALIGRGSIAGALLKAAEVNLLIALGQGNPAGAAVRGAYAGHSLLQVPAARLALLSGDLATAAQLAQDHSWQAVATQRDRLDMLLIQAVAAHRGGDRESAERGLSRAIGIARVTGLWRPFATVPRADLVQLAVRVPSCGAALSRPGMTQVGELFPATLALVALTNREQRVLAALAEGLSSGQIAAHLVVSTNTIKSHIKSLYRKLGANSRAEALASARAWGLLPDWPGTPPRGER